MNRAFRWSSAAIKSVLGEMKAAGVVWSVDQFSFHDGVVSVSGWCGCARDRVDRLGILLSYDDGGEEEIDVSCGIKRPDVGSMHPDIGDSAGFFAHRGTARTENPLSVSLIVCLASGRHFRAPIPFHVDLSGHGRVTLSSRLYTMRRYVERALFHLFRGNLKLIWQRVKLHLPTLLARSATGGKLKSLLEALPPDCALVMDHALGGGANHYRDERVNAFGDSGKTVLLWTYAPLASGFQLAILSEGGDEKLFRVARQDWDDLVKSQRISNVVFNNCVSFPLPETVPGMLGEFVKDSNVTVSILLHDFFPVCPSHFLINADGQYCGLPDRGVCRSCLPRIDDGLVSLYQARDIDHWRSIWGDVLEGADEIIAFSDNTKRLYLEAYPRLPEERVRVRPHSVDYVSGRYVAPPASARPVVAVVGDINHHKGSEVFVELVARSRELQCDLDFVVVGTLNAHQRDPIDQTGPYARQDLARILSERKIAVVLMLSIWPETFSYVTHELIALQVPLLSFDIGAQGDAVRNYTLGRVVPLSDGRALLEHVLDFAQALNARHSVLDAL